MPFKSEAQRRKFGELVEQGKVSQATFDEWNSDTPASLPERVTPQAQAKAPSLAKMVKMGRKAQVIK